MVDPKNKQSYQIRRIFISSSEEQQACRQNRTRQMERAEGDLKRVQANVGTRWYETHEKVQKAIDRALEKHRVTSHYRVEVGMSDGVPTLTWERDQAAIAAAEALDGFYVLVTNLPAERYDISQVFQLYKHQYRVDRRYGDFKGPLALSPLFLKDNRRIAALVFIVYLALLIYCLMEREVRRALADPVKSRWEPPTHDQRRRRTYALKDPAEAGKIRWAIGQPAERPTGSNILRHLQGLNIAIMKIGNQLKVLPSEMGPALTKLHELLGVPEPRFF